MISDAPIDRSLVPPALQDIDHAALVAEFGTPLFVYDEDELRRRCRQYRDLLGTNGAIYAAKAFLCAAMARLVAEEGLHLDVATGGELHVALTAGFPAERMVFHGNNKSETELRAALTCGVGRIVADSFDELDHLDVLAGDLDARPEVLVRVTPGVEAHTHEYIETGTEDSKFGFTVSDGIALAAIDRVAASSQLRFAGMHCHIGSQIQRLDPWDGAVAVLADLAGQLPAGVAVRELNLGGGLGARYLADDPPMDVDAYIGALRAALDRWWGARAGRPVPELRVEPGRSIAAPCAITLYRVGVIKEIPEFGTYVAVDGGMSDNPRPVLYGAGYEAYLPARIDDDRPLRCRVVGKHCEQGDVLVPNAQLPAGVQRGDLLATPTTGAYGYSMASNYNKVPRPAVVFVRDGRARVVVRRETDDDLLRLDAVGD
ncbi:MAG TPA: diaminopimelate decarboxylase [Acidimicrobiia bacterium]|nr:diaminopimelate decarboxylase [Acidimicrobiia bacterium]